MKLFIFAAVSALGWVGWWAGQQISPDDLSWALILSGVGSIAGVFVGWWIGRKVGAE